MQLIESQFKIPEGAVSSRGGAKDTPEDYTAAEDAEFLEIFTANYEYQYTPEEHAKLRRLESRIDQYRQEAMAQPVASESKRGRFLWLFGIERSSYPSLEELVDKESLVGGESFRVPSRFWLQPASPEEPGVRDWYFSFYKEQTEYTIHYQTNETGVHKIYGGVRYDFTHGEQERFVEAVNAYEQRISSSVYGKNSSAVV